MTATVEATGTRTDHERIKRIRAAIKADTEFDAVVLASPVNTWYASQVVVHTQKTLPTRLALVVWPHEGEPTYIVCTLEELQARAESWIPDIRAYFEFKESPIGLLGDVLREKGLAGGKIGIETDFLTVDNHEELKAALKGAQLRPSQTFMQKLRMIKTDAEVEILGAGAQATDRAIRTTFESVRVGDTEKAISARLQSTLLEEGADSIAFIVLAAAANGCLTHPVPGDYRVKSGDLLRTDFGGVFYGGYHSDVARTMVVGRPRDGQVDTYRKLWDVRNKLIDMFRPGVRPSEIYAKGRELNLAAGLSFVRPHIGHGLGIEMHEAPMLNPYSDELLRPGMVFSIEPNHLVPGVEKYHVEDLVLVTSDKPRVLSESADWSDLYQNGLGGRDA